MIHKELALGLRASHLTQVYVAIGRLAVAIHPQS